MPPSCPFTPIKTALCCCTLNSCSQYLSISLHRLIGLSRITSYRKEDFQRKTDVCFYFRTCWYVRQSNESNPRFAEDLSVCEYFLHLNFTAGYFLQHLQVFCYQQYFEILVVNKLRNPGYAICVVLFREFH